MSLLLFLVFGLVVGLLARALLPGKQSMGLIMTTVLGIVGSLLGGLVGSMFSGSEVTRLTPAGIIGSVIGALAVLAIVGWIGRRRQVTV
jgi:uncharacterized membrane protein YeaQ/YmgE (transglycosylase-associated protein family)